MQQSPSHQTVLQEAGFEESHSDNSGHLYQYVRLQSPTIEVTRTQSIYPQTGLSTSQSSGHSSYSEDLRLLAPSSGAQLNQNSSNIIERLVLANQAIDKRKFRNIRTNQLHQDSFISQEDHNITIEIKRPEHHSPLIQQTVVDNAMQTSRTEELEQITRTEKLDVSRTVELVEDDSRAEDLEMDTRAEDLMMDTRAEDLEEGSRVEELEQNSRIEEFEQDSRTEEKMYLDDFVEIYTIFKCRKCVFTCASKGRLTDK